MTDYIKYAIAFVLFVVTGTMVMIPIFVSSMPSNNHVEEPESPRVIKVTHVPSKSESTPSSYDESKVITSLNQREREEEQKKQEKEVARKAAEEKRKQELERAKDFRIASRPSLGSLEIDFKDSYGTRSSFVDFLTCSNGMMVSFEHDQAYQIDVPAGRSSLVEGMIPKDAVSVKSARDNSDLSYIQDYTNYTSKTLEEIMPKTRGRFCVIYGYDRLTRRLDSVIVSSGFFENDFFTDDPF